MSNRSRSAIEVYEAHVAALASGDVEAVVADYAADAVLASSAGIGRGHEHVRSVFAQFFASEETISPHTSVMSEPDVVFVTWTADAGGRSISGADTFVVRDGLIAVHTGFIAGPATTG